MAAKEFIQMRRDRLTFAMMIGIPVIQLIIFGFAINTDPKHLPAVVYAADNSAVTRSIIHGLHNTDYFDIVGRVDSRSRARELLARGEVQFVVTVPAGFTRDLVRGDKPVLFIEADATDPAATGGALNAVRESLARALGKHATGPLAHLAPPDLAVTPRLHADYNPENVTQYNIVPGLLGVILTLTLVIITGLAITRERERGTMENLLATPYRPFEIMAGKIVPYILFGYIQMTIILLAARFLFQVPMHGSILLVYGLSLLFIAANLAMGLAFSTIAASQLQAMQLSIFFFLPSILLSGFMFPFRGMPAWAQVVGEALPLTHYLRIVRGILLKGSGLAEVWGEIWPLAAFLAVVLAVALKRFSRTLE
jgi:ABC-2 type transport system permease protein